ncbi:unnamed protein product [Cuscuta campestris]|uniref:CCHC-type domain-containing protein n=1 Tax=Cuscuta campestris TaxID=132261 RepID=A0A484MDY5_9ASTE|nr:unnamed protein product [Cuscuta campestris]
MVNNMDTGLPKFSLLGYDDWKIMMEAHLYALHDCMWMVLEDGPLKIQMENPERDPTNPDVVWYIPKPKEKLDDRDCKKHNPDNVAKAVIFKTLDPISFSKIKNLRTAMEIWQGLGKLCEGSKDLRKQKIEVLHEKFKSFKMLPGESFVLLDERFHMILNDLASLNHVLSPKGKNVMLLRSLPDEWYTKATAMEEGRNLENYTVQGLLDELRTYEHELEKKKKEEQAKNYEEEFAMMVKQFWKFKKFFKKTNSVRRPSKGKLHVSNSPPESYLFYNCRKPGHWKSACPYPKVEKYGEGERNEKKKKAMVAAESDESSRSSSDEEALVCMEQRAEKSKHEDREIMSEGDTLCLMAKDDADQEVTSQASCSSSYESIPTSENLFDKFKKMMEDFEEINLKHSSLTEENKLVSEENLKLTEGWKSQLSEITQLKAENESLSKKVKTLNKELGILKSKEAVDKLLETTKKRVVKDLGLTPPVPKGKGEQHLFLPNLLRNPLSRKATKSSRWVLKDTPGTGNTAPAVAVLPLQTVDTTLRLVAKQLDGQNQDGPDENASTAVETNTSAQAETNLFQYDPKREAKELEQILEPGAETYVFEHEAQSAIDSDTNLEKVEALATTIVNGRNAKIPKLADSAEDKAVMMVEIEQICVGEDALENNQTPTNTDPNSEIEQSCNDQTTTGPILHSFEVDGQHYEIRSYEEAETSNLREEPNDFQDVQNKRNKKAGKRGTAPRTIKTRSYDPNLEVGTVSEITRYWPSCKSTTIEKIVTTKSYSGPFWYVGPVGPIGADGKRPKKIMPRNLALDQHPGFIIWE